MVRLLLKSPGFDGNDVRCEWEAVDYIRLCACSPRPAAYLFTAVFIKADGDEDDRGNKAKVVRLWVCSPGSSDNPIGLRIEPPGGDVCCEREPINYIRLCARPPRPATYLFAAVLVKTEGDEDNRWHKSREVRLWVCPPWGTSDALAAVLIKSDRDENNRGK
jgi:hypothetical protein